MTSWVLLAATLALTTPPADAARHSIAHDEVDHRVLGLPLEAPAPQADPVRASAPGLRSATDATWRALAEIPPGNGGALAYDLRRHHAVWVGSQADNRSLSMGVWVLETGTAGTSWRRVPPRGAAPRPRSHHTVVFAPAENRFLLFGGFHLGSAGGPSVLGDVWALSVADSATWEQLTPQGVLPHARFDHTAAYDVARGRMLVFGGGADSLATQFLNDLWSFTTTPVPAWTSLPVQGLAPSARLGHSMDYDGAGDRLILFGGYDGRFRADVWALPLANAAAAWVEITPSVTIEPRGWHAAALDPGTHVLWIHGGHGRDEVLQDAWQLPLEAPPQWIRLDGFAAMGRLAHHRAVVDPVRHRVVLCAPAATNMGVAWAATTDSGASAAVSPLTPGGPLGKAVHDPTRRRLVILDAGNVARMTAWTCDLTTEAPTWRRAAPADPSPVRRRNYAWVRDARRDRLLLFGGVRDDNSNTNETWEFTLADERWRLIQPVHSPPKPGYDHVVFCDSMLDRMRVVGGWPEPERRMWDLDLADPPTWSEVAPPARVPLSMLAGGVVLDSRRNRLSSFASPARCRGSQWWTLDLAPEPFLAWKAEPWQVRNALGVYDPRGDRALFFLDNGQVSSIALENGNPSTLAVDGEMHPQFIGSRIALDDRVLCVAADVVAHPETAGMVLLWALDLHRTNSVSANGEIALQPPVGPPFGSESLPDWPAVSHPVSNMTAAAPGDRLTAPGDAGWADEFALGTLQTRGIQHLTLWNGTPVGAFDDASIRVWDGAAWNPLPQTPRGDEPVTAMTTHQGRLIVAIQREDPGSCSFGCPVYAWDGTHWTTMGGFNRGLVHAFVTYGDWLFAGGSFDSNGGLFLRTPFIAYWGGVHGDQDLWYGMPGNSGPPDGPVYALAVHDGQLVAGGAFGVVGSLPAHCIARWTAGHWSLFGGDTGLDSSVLQLAVRSDGALVAAGAFAHAGRPGAVLRVNGIAIWDGVQWSDAGGGVRKADGRNASIQVCIPTGTDLLVAGDFDAAGTASAAGLARWDGLDWTGVASDGPVRGWTPDGGRVLIGGGFRHLGTALTGTAAHWNGAAGQPLTPVGYGLDGRVRAFAHFRGALYAAGGFQRTAGNTAPAGGVVRWSGSRWEDAQASGAPRALITSNDRLIAGGVFTNGTFVQSYDGAAWADLAPGARFTAGPVNALALVAGRLIAGGDFTEVATSPAAGLAAFDGTQWTALPAPSELVPPVSALLARGDSLFVGAQNGVFWLYGSAGGRVGEAASGAVQALAWHGGNLIAGGSFTSIGGSPVPGIARWEGAAWGALGAFGLETRALLVDRGVLYAAGADAPEAPVGGVARWNGTAWIPLGSGLSQATGNSGGYSLAVDGDALWVGGFFERAGGKLSSNVGRWTLTTPPRVTLGVLQNPYVPSRLDVYLAASDALAANSVRVTAGSEPVPMQPVDASGRVWRGELPASAPDGAVLLRGCGRSLAGEDVCAERLIGTGTVSETTALVLGSADGRLSVRVPPGAFDPGTRLVITGLESGYEIQPASLQCRMPLCFELRIDTTGPAPVPIDAAVLVASDGTRPRAFIDRERRLLVATIRQLGVYAVRAGEPGATPAANPQALRVSQGTPNPFNPATYLDVEIETAQRMQVRVFDARGRQVCVLQDGVLQPGRHRVEWTGVSSRGWPAASGVYFVRVDGAHAGVTRKVQLVR